MSSTTEGQTTQPATVRYRKGESCVQRGAVHSYAKVEGKNYERCAACGSTRTAKAVAAPAAEQAPAPAPAVELTPQHKDLATGADMRGDVAVFLYRSHVRADGSLDKRAAKAVDEFNASLGAGGPTFFRVLDESGRETGTHGWVENGKVTQWG